MQRNDQKVRTIVVRFSRFSDREAVVRIAFSLRRTIIFVNEDLCPASQEVKRDRMTLLKQARTEGQIAYLRYTRLIVKERVGLSAGPSRGGDNGTRDIGLGWVFAQHAYPQTLYFTKGRMNSVKKCLPHCVEVFRSGNSSISTKTCHGCSEVGHIFFRCPKNAHAFKDAILLLVVPRTLAPLKMKFLSNQT